MVTDAFLINAYYLGLGRHLFYVPLKNVPETFKWLWAAEPTNLFAVYLVRLSIALFFLRLVPPKRRFVWTLWATIGMLTVADIYVSIDFFFECRPIRKVWLPQTPGACFSNVFNQSALWLFQGTLAFFSCDFRPFRSLLLRESRANLSQRPRSWQTLSCCVSRSTSSGGCKSSCGRRSS